MCTGVYYHNLSVRENEMCGSSNTRGCFACSCAGCVNKNVKRSLASIEDHGNISSNARLSSFRSNSNDGSGVDVPSPTVFPATLQADATAANADSCAGTGTSDCKLSVVGTATGFSRRHILVL